MLEKLSNENKIVALMSDFNIDLLKYDSNIDLSNFLDKTYTSFPLSYISSPSRVTTRSQTLTDNIFSNNIEENINSRILTSKISDHYAQFLLFPTTNSPSLPTPHPPPPPPPHLFPKKKEKHATEKSNAASNPSMKKNLNVN